MSAASPVETQRPAFESLVRTEFSFLSDEFRLVGPLFSEFAGTYFSTWDGIDTRVVLWCAKRDDDVWTYIQRIEIWRAVGLDTADALGGSGDYPPSGSWASTIEDRLRLEAEILRRNAARVLGTDVSVFDEVGSPIRPDVVALDDPVETFPRRCTERFAFLENEVGLAREFDEHGAAVVVWRGPSRAVRISLHHTLYEWEEDEGSPALSAELIELEDGRLPSFLFDTEELEISERTEPFTVDYLEAGFDEIEQILRNRIGELRA